jgi:hypothetical protein
VDAPERRTARRAVEALRDQAPEVAELERRERQRHEPIAQPALELAAERPAGAGAAGEQDPHRQVEQPRQRECQHPRRRRIEPLLVVDGHHHRLVRGEAAQQAEQSAAHRLGIRGRDLRRLQVQRRAQRVPLRSRQVGQPLVRHAVEQIAQAGEGQRGVGLAGFAGEHARRDEPEHFAPQRRLADPGRALDHHRPRFEARSEDLADPLALRLPSDHTHRRDTRRRSDPTAGAGRGTSLRRPPIYGCGLRP